MIIFFQVMRQNDYQPIEAINQLSDGNTTEQTELFLKNIDRPLPDES